MMDMTLPVDIRHNNPGNLREGRVAWQGQRGAINYFCVFDTMRNGIRAMAAQLMIYQTRYKLTTIEQYIARWAPSNENDTAAYVRAVAHDVDTDPGEPYDLNDRAALTALVKAIIKHENGLNKGAPWCSDLDIDNGVGDAIASFT